MGQITVTKTNEPAQQAQQIVVEQDTSGGSAFQNILDQYGIAVDVGAVVVIVILIQMVKKPLKKWQVNRVSLGKQTFNVVSFLPLLLSFVVVFFMDVGESLPDKGWYGGLIEWGKRTLLYTAGCYILYNVIWARISGESN